MMAVITDDFTGASEVAGVAFAKGFSTVIETRPLKEPSADVLIVATNMRSRAPQQAAAESEELTRQVLEFSPDFIFKKVDSVLRGNIGPELHAQMQAESKPRALVVPANPRLHRTIVDGIYYVGDTPFAESDFAKSGSYTADTSSVVQILADRGTKDAVCLSPGDRFPDHGVFIGNTTCPEDLETWAKRVDSELVPAGAAEFFAAVLDASNHASSALPSHPASNGGGRALYVCGSKFPSSRVAVLEAGERGACVVEMPDDLYFSDRLDEKALERWAREVTRQLEQHSRVIIVALQVPGAGSLQNGVIADAMAQVVRRAVERELIDRLMLEGGATSEAVMRALDVNCLYPTESLAPGVTRMQVGGYPGLEITMKPGSYRWPASIWNNVE